MDSERLTQKLGEVRNQIPAIKNHGVKFSNTAEFEVWKNGVIKWLKLGLPNTSDEVQRFQSMDFGYYDDFHADQDQQQYEKDCDITTHLLDSAIENIEEGLVPGASEHTKTAGRTKRDSKYGGVNITKAETVVMGDSNIVSIVDSITISGLLEILEKEIQAKVTDPDQKTGLIQSLKALSTNPTFTTILSQTLGQVLRGASGQ